MSDSIALLNSIQTIANSLAKSKLFGNHSADDWASLMFIAHAEGRHPASVATDYHIINGRPALRSEAILARFQKAGGTVEWLNSTDQSVTGKFTHPQGGTIEVTWDMKRAAAAGINNPMWRKYPQQMMRARAVSEAVRAIYPLVLCGLYDEVEVSDFTATTQQPAVQKSLPNVQTLPSLSDEELNELIHEHIVPAVDLEELANGMIMLRENYGLTDAQIKIVERAYRHVQNQIIAGAINNTNTLSGLKTLFENVKSTQKLDDDGLKELVKSKDKRKKELEALKDQNAV